MKAKKAKRETGYILVGVLVLTALAGIISASILELTASFTKTRAVVDKHSEYYYDVEYVMGKTIAWFQQNSTSIVAAFDGTTFDANFTIGAPTVGDNEGQHFQIPSLIKINGTNDTPLLSTNNFFGTANFPVIGGFDAATEFANADLGDANVRVMMVWARVTDGHYEPVFRIDVVTANEPDRGPHSYSYMYSSLVTSNASNTGLEGYHGVNSFTTNGKNNKILSLSYTFDPATSTWSPGAARSNAVTSSEAGMTVGGAISGSANAVTSVTYGTKGSANTTCDSSTVGNPTVDCPVPTLVAIDDWNTRCSGVGADTTFTGAVTLASGGCWRDITIANGATLTLTDTSTPYVFRNITFGSSSNSAIAVATVGDSSAPYEIYADSFTGNVNANQLYFANVAPHKIKFHLAGSYNQKFNGTATFNAWIIAPLVNVTLQGNFIFRGAVQALSYTQTGRAIAFFDEEIGVGGGGIALQDVNFALKKASQRYR